MDAAVRSWHDRLTIAEAGEYLRVSRATIWRLISTGRLRKLQLTPRRGSRAFVYREDLDQLIAEGTVARQWRS